MPNSSAVFSLGDEPGSGVTYGRLRVLGSLVVAAVVAVVSFLVFGEIDRQLERNKEAQSDNRTWALAQIEVDLQRLQIALLEAELNGAGKTQIDRINVAFNILFSRVELVRTARSLDSLPMRTSEGWRRLTDASGLMPVMADILDHHPDRLVANLPRLYALTAATAPELRASITDSLTATVEASDATRESFRASLLVFSSSLMFIMGVMAILLLAIFQQGRVQSRHARMLGQAVRNLRTTIEASHDCVLLIDDTGMIAAWNHVGAEMLGLTASLARRRWQDHLGTEGVAGLEHCTRQQIQCRRVDGSELPAELTVVSTVTPMGRPFRVAFLRDMSEQLSRERRLADALSIARSGEEAKARFVAVMSHEMRTPLNGLLSAVELLDTTTELDDQQRWLVEIMRGCGQATLEQVNNVLELTHLASSEGSSYAMADFALHDQLQAQVQQFQAGALRHGNVLQLEAPPGDRTTIRAPLQLLRRVVNNLLSNAVKFTQDGEITVGYEVAPGDRPGHILCHIHVTDTGIGVAAADLDRIFHNFETLDSSYSRVQEGSGLGLGIVKLAAEALKGRISVDSSPGQGSRFTLSFQAETAAMGPDTVLPVPVPAMGEGLLRILIAEDNEINRTLLVRQLERFGHDLVAVRNGEEAVEAVETDEPFDVVLMDISMPRMDGVTATRLLRHSEGGRHLPIIALTAQADQRRIEQFRAAGMNEIIAKPADTARLLATIAKVMTEVTRGESRPLPEPVSPALPQSLINPARLREMAEDMGQDFLRGIVGRFSAEMDLALTEITAAQARGDSPALAQLAHHAAGSTAVLGFDALGRELRAIEDISLAQGAAATKAVVGRLSATYAASRAELAILMPDHSG